MVELSSGEATHELTAYLSGDSNMSSQLERMLDAKNLTTSYKIYWMCGILDETIAGNTLVPLRRLAARMVAKAWYPVTHFELNLGKDDRIAETIEYAKEVCFLGDEAREEEIVNTLLESSDVLLSSRLIERCRYVQSRIIRPFYEERLTRERQRLGLNSRQFDGRVNRLIVEYNCEDPAGAPYRFVSEYDAIEIDHNWAQYFRNNQLIVHEWLDMQLVNYLQVRNPNVQAISCKIHPPEKRN